MKDGKGVILTATFSYNIKNMQRIQGSKETRDLGIWSGILRDFNKLISAVYTNNR